MKYILLLSFFVLVFSFSYISTSFAALDFPEEISIVIIAPETASAGERILVDVEIQDKMGNTAEHVNYDIIVTQGDKTLIDEHDVHSMDGLGTHLIPALSSNATDEMPLEIMITFQGFGMQKIKVGPIGETEIMTVPTGMEHVKYEDNNDGMEEIQKIPEWVKNIFTWYSQDQISEDEVLNAIKFLINQKIIDLDD
tara:strand:- start:245 stop:832 length:588 start_codon:yes stop_codon:yes gene_type:complete